MKRNEGQVEPFLRPWPVVWVRVAVVWERVQLVRSMPLYDILAVRLGDGSL